MIIWNPRADYSCINVAHIGSVVKLIINFFSKQLQVSVIFTEYRDSIYSMNVETNTETVHC